MDPRKFFEGKKVRILGIAGIFLVILVIGVFRYMSSPEKGSAPSDTLQAEIEAAKEEGYKLGQTEGYRQGYEAARKEIGSGAFTTYGITGFTLGLLLGIGGVAALNRKALSERVRTLRKKHELKKAFSTIPPNLSSDVYATAEQIARAYANISEQFRDAKGYSVDLYIKQWRPKLKELMAKAVQLMELIRELETARTNVDGQKLDRTITGLRYTVRHAQNDETRNAAVKSLRRAKQTQSDLQKTNSNLEKCKTALKGIVGVLESMHLKISNIKVNTRKTDLLDELSSDLEAEMSALEEALKEFRS